MTKIYAFIPARAGSKRIPKKNVHSFYGKKLYAWTIEYAQKSGLFDKIYISTDISEILKDQYLSSNIVLLKRDKILADSHSTILEVLLHTAEKQRWHNDDILVILQVTAPLRVSSDLTEGLTLFDNHNRRHTVVSVSENLYPPTLLWQINNNNQLSPFNKTHEQYSTRKQDYSSTYIWNDILVIDTIGGFKQPNRNLFGSNPIPVIVPHDRCMPIDYPVQLKLAEALFPPFDERTNQIEWMEDKLISQSKEI